jgi:hypothetical protein
VEQYVNLAGIDVITSPPKIASQLRQRADELPPIEPARSDYALGLNDDVDPHRIGLDTLWDVEDKLVACIDALGREDFDLFNADKRGFLRATWVRDFCWWSNSEIATSAEEAKPKLGNWADQLAPVHRAG